MFTHASPGGGLLLLNTLIGLFQRDAPGFQAHLPSHLREPAPPAVVAAL
jgi:hypothetical protein